MSRTKGTYTLTSNIEPKVGAPLDARTIVKLKTDLTASGTFDYPYKGLTVFVEEENKKYTLIGADPTVSANWMEESASGAAADITYDNTTSQLQSTNVQDAIDELNAKPAGVQSNWTEDDTSDLSYIQNKPENLVQDADYVHTDNNYSDTDKGKVDALGTASTKDIPESGNAGNDEVVLGNDSRLSDARPASDVSSWAKASTKPSYTASEVGAIASTLKGVANGVAELDAAGKVPSSQLPSFVDDVIEVADYDHLPITGESGKIYVTLDANKTYRWTGSGYAEISESLALGETSATAYRGDRGKTAYDHSQDSGRITTAVSSGLYKVAATAQGHIAGLTAVEKSDITALGIPAQDTTYGVVSKTANGLAPQLPNETTTTKYLRQDGTWQVPPDNDTTYTVATGDNNGQIKVTPSSGSAYNVGVKGLGSAAYANLANTVMEVGKAASRSTATVGTWTAMCNTTSTGSPKLPSASKWWNVMSLNNWSDSATNWVSQLGVPTQDVNGTPVDTVWFKHNDASGTNIDSSTWHSLVSGNIVGAARLGTTGSTTKIKININSETSWMLCFVVTLYQGYRSTKVMISGYNYSSNHWHQPVAKLLADSTNAAINVYFGYDANWKLWVGFDGSSYTGVSVSDVCNGYTQITDYNNLFTISNVSSLATLQTTIAAGKPDAATVNGLTFSLVT